jgi:hypothetical protein
MAEVIKLQINSWDFRKIINQNFLISLLSFDIERFSLIFVVSHSMIKLN